MRMSLRGLVTAEAPEASKTARGCRRDAGANLEDPRSGAQTGTGGPDEGHDRQGRKNMTVFKTITRPCPFSVPVSIPHTQLWPTGPLGRIPGTRTLYAKPQVREAMSPGRGLPPVHR